MPSEKHATIIDLLRHGEPQGGRRYRGHGIDDPLNEKGWVQMRAAVAGHCPWTQIVSSPLQRCQAFARELSRQQDIPLSVDERLKEVGFGDWEGFTRAEIQARDPAGYHAFYADPVNCRPPGAESLAAFFSRVSAALEDIVSDFAGRQVLVVAHAGVIRGVIAHVLRTPAETAYRVQVNNAALSRVHHRGNGFELDFHNCPTIPESKMTD
ncbi:MAG TPA: histidine phosphatase family protein [Gammaproteobacteria bacterium]|nr:histidine phosphatase family protein [Gammaproteobacteria bacterium]